MAKNSMYRVPDNVRNALGADTVMGMSPNVNRLSLLPRYDAQDGLVAPQWLYDLARAAQAPGNALMGAPTSPEEAFNFAGNVALGGIGTSAMMRNPAPGPGKTIPATVYHGSPHRINNVDEANPVGKFDLSKVGTGEGAQAYGHGIYLAESPGVAKQYRNMVSAELPDGTTIRPGPFDDEFAGINALHESGGDYAKARAIVGQRKGASGEIAALDRLEAKGAKVNPGHFYTVDLPDEHIANMLDWDAPLSQQPEAVRKAFADIYESLPSWGKSNSYTASNGYAKMYPDHGEADGSGIYELMSRTLGGQDKATEALRKAGIPGIRYLDGGSRAAGEGTRNFVIFDGDTARILKRE